MGQIFRVIQLMKETDDKELGYEIGHATNVYSESFSMRFFVHDSLFRNVVNMLGNEEQQERYNDDISNFRIFGCFAMVISSIKMAYMWKIVINILVLYI
jgi:acyl-CoA oxidase